MCHGQNSSPEGESKDILITSDMQINLVVGDNWTTEDKQSSSFEWSVYGKAGHAIGSGVASIKLPEQVSLKM